MIPQQISHLFDIIHEVKHVYGKLGSAPDGEKILTGDLHTAEC